MMASLRRSANYCPRIRMGAIARLFVAMWMGVVLMLMQANDAASDLVTTMLPDLAGNELQLLSDRIANGELRKACSTHGNPQQPSGRIDTTIRLRHLRELMRNEVVLKGHTLDAYIITSSDEHQTEFVAEYDRRQEFMSGFSGSYGHIIVTMDRAVLWTDGRYHLQADEQLDCNWLLMRMGYTNVTTKEDWLKRQFPNGANIGVDPKLISQSTWKQMEFEFGGPNSKMKLLEIETNLVDVLWKSGRPTKRNKDVFLLPDEYSGMKWTFKIAQLRKELLKLRADAMVVTALDEVAWLLNIRGRDTPFSPFVRSYAIVDMNEIRLFINQSQLLKNNVMKYFNSTRMHYKNTLRTIDYESACDHLRRLSQIYQQVLIPSSCSFSGGASRYIFQCIPSSKRLFRPSPIILLKAKKNPIEIQGMQNAHIRDAAAMCEFFAYFESRYKSGSTFTELELVKVMNEFRFEQMYSLGNSFRTIAGFGANGAQPHYEPTPVTNVEILNNSTLVLDSGGQYYDGTTDVSRTVHLGTPTKEQKDAYTRVLIGQIQLSTLTFPSNMQTAVADVMARAPLWEVGLDYMHGTSHGVGSFLGVHEAPISMTYTEFNVNPIYNILQPGYFLSNEPGFYQEGEFGIRLENVLEVVEKPWLRHNSGRAFLGFKVITLIPYERKLINLDLMTVQQRRWLNTYNQRIRSKVGAELKKQNLMNGFYWMMEKTDYIPENGQSRLHSDGYCGVLLLEFVVFLYVKLC